VGNDGSQTHIAYVRPALPESLKSVGSEVIIQDASARIYEKSGNRSSQTLSMRLVTGGEWSSLSHHVRLRPCLQLLLLCFSNR